MKCYIDLFSGIGGFALGAYWAGLRFDKHYFSEIDPYCVELYKKRFPEAILLGDIKDVDYSKLPKGEYLVTGGFPCQSHSVAGQKKGSEDERDLWGECARMLRDLRPSIALFENVTGLFNSDEGRFFNRILSDIHRGGYNAEWEIISASEIGAPHKRKRVWIVTYPQSFGLHENKLQSSYIRKGGQEKPTEWKQLLSVSARAYKIQHWKNYEQILTGNNDGLTEELDRLKGIGNSVVPQCVEMILRLPTFDYFRETA